MEGDVLMVGGFDTYFFIS